MPSRWGKSNHGEHLTGCSSLAEKRPRSWNTILDVQSLDSLCPMVQVCQRQALLPVILHSTPTSPTPAEAADEISSALAYTSKTSVKCKCHTQPYAFRLVGWPKDRPDTLWLLENVTSPKSPSTHQRSWHTATMRPYEAGARSDLPPACCSSVDQTRIII